MRINELFETFDKVYPITGGKVSSDQYLYNFTAKDNTKVVVNITGSEHQDDNNEYVWDITFSRETESDPFDMELTGQGDANAVLSTVLYAINSFIKEENPKYMELLAAKDYIYGRDTSKKQSREKLYTRMLKRFLPKSYRINQRSSRIGTVWFINKDEVYNEA